MRQLLLALVACYPSAALAQAKPTREAIVAYVKECLDQKVDIDLIGKFGTDYRELDLRGIDLRGESWNGQTVTTIWRGADLTGANLEGAILSGVILDGANLSGANLRGSSLSCCPMHNARLDDANLEEARLDHARLSAGSLKRAKLMKAEISNAVFDDADLTGAILRQVRCQWYPPRFRRANLSGADFEGAQLLPEANFSGSNLAGVHFRGVALIQADFRGANLAKANLNDADIQYALFDNVRGITPREQAGLRRRAARWQFHLLAAVEAILRLGHVVAFVLAPLCALGLGVRLRRQATPQSQQTLATLAICLNGIALLALLSVFLFGFFGSPVAQFNVGNALGMEAWSLWVRFWPMLMRGIWLGMGVAAIVLGVTLVKTLVEPRNWWRTSLCWGLTVLHFGFEIHFVGRCFPTA